MFEKPNEINIVLLTRNYYLINSKDLCLDVNLTIKETLEYYGTLYAMSKAHIAERIKELTQFLKLPDFNSYIGKLR